ncbi:MAG: hypothetical protein ACR2J8_06315, partial [Thermomicrobiales bacterium]
MFESLAHRSSPTLSRRTVVSALAVAPLVGIILRAANAAAAEPVNPGWVTVRNFTLKPDADRAALVESSRAEFAPVLQDVDGFVAYAVY